MEEKQTQNESMSDANLNDQMGSNTNTQTGESSSADADQNKTLMGILSYIGPLVLVPYFTSKDDSFIKFHIKQGLVLFSIEVAVWVVGMMIWMLWPILQIVNIVLIVLAIVGILNVVKGKENQLPLVGKFAKHFKI